MAISQDVQDINNYPGIVKRITLDVDTIVPTGTEGDEKMMVTASTTAYSDNTARTAIQDIYVFKGYVGWAKSTGLKGSAGKFALDATTNKIGINMDATVSGTYTYNSKPYYEITLDYNTNSVPKSGEDIAADLQLKIRAITAVTADVGFQLSYLNCTVTFSNSKFIISSGEISNSYIGADRSSVSVAPGQTDDCSSLLGFDHPVTSEDISGQTILEALLASDYTTDTATMTIGPNTGVQTGDALYITDGTNEDYFSAIGVSGNDVTVAVSGTNGYVGVSNSYAVADGSYVQILKKQDPDVAPNPYLGDMDATLRYMSKSLINQIDFSS